MSSLNLISYGVDPRRARKILERSPERLLEDMLEDDAAWFMSCDARHAYARARTLGYPTAFEATRQVLRGLPLHAAAAPLYAEVAKLCCEYVGERLPVEHPYTKRGLPWDDVVECWLDELLDEQGGFRAHQLRHAELVELCTGFGGFSHHGVGWLSAAQCEALDELFAHLREPEDEGVEGDQETWWEEEEREEAAEHAAWQEVEPIVRVLESWVLTCRERGWAMATFSR